MKTKYPECCIGQKVRALKTIDFVDGTKHVKGKVYVIKKGETAYYSVNHKDYQLL